MPHTPLQRRTVWRGGRFHEITDTGPGRTKRNVQTWPTHSLTTALHTGSSLQKHCLGQHNHKEENTHVGGSLPPALTLLLGTVPKVLCTYQPVCIYRVSPPFFSLIQMVAHCFAHSGLVGCFFFSFIDFICQREKE